MFNSELRRGSLELLILSVLEGQRRHGYDIGKVPERRSGGKFVFAVSTLYTILYRMEGQGWIRGRWVEKKGERRRCYYTLTPDGKRVLDQNADRIKSQYSGYLIQVEGHTDNVPIGASGWKSNWELGSARALAVLHYLEDQHGISGGPLSVASFAQHKSVASNSTGEGRARNRRTTIVLYGK